MPDRPSVIPRDSVLDLFVSRMNARVWRGLAAGALAAIVVATWSFTSRRSFAAPLTLSSSAPVRSPLAAQGLSLGLLTGANLGLQSTPSLVANLATSIGVVRRLVPSADSSALREDLLRRLGLEVDARDVNIEQVLRACVVVSLDRENGLVSIRVIHKDSALTRLVAGRLVAAVTDAFSTASRTQARLMHNGLSARVDSATRQLAHAEQVLREFTASNRVVSAFALASLERDRLGRAVALAQTTLTQVLTEQEAAIARELEQTPAIFVLDPVPRELVPQPRHTVLRGSVAGVVVTIAFVALSALFSTARPRT